MTHSNNAIQKDPSIIYDMPHSLFSMYRKIVRLLAQARPKELALVVANRDKDWEFHISNAKGKSIHRVFAYKIDTPSRAEGKGFNFFYAFELEEEEAVTKTEEILASIQKSIEHKHCDTQMVFQE